MVKIDVITYLHQDEKFLQNCFKGLKDQDISFNWHLLCYQRPVFNFETLNPIIHLLPAPICNKAQAYNFILPQLNAPFIAFNDADDCSLKNRFSAQINYLNKNENIDILGGGLIINSKYQGWKVKLNNQEILNELIFNNPMVNSSIMIRNRPDFWGKVVKYNNTLNRAEDYDFWFSCAKNNLIFANLEIPLIDYKKNNAIKCDEEKINAREVRRLALNWRLNITVNDQYFKLFNAYSEKKYLFFWQKNRLKAFLKNSRLVID